ncbi:hypothetical protein BD410DRAFT_436298 [Rickenella mellea]|uniref:Uncharacterized protein n=1 Tax=Rickenella mellea TaxID=50990 RepID=A0A4Y7PWF7_9AGAM|nr:hypothetical protein BD410DRAFT_436298 [Rickenella mellea]
MTNELRQLEWLSAGEMAHSLASMLMSFDYYNGGRCYWFHQHVTIRFTEMSIWMPFIATRQSSPHTDWTAHPTHAATISACLGYRLGTTLRIMTRISIHRPDSPVPFPPRSIAFVSTSIALSNMKQFTDLTAAYFVDRLHALLATLLLFRINCQVPRCHTPHPPQCCLGFR